MVHGQLKLKNPFLRLIIWFSINQPLTLNEFITQITEKNLVYLKSLSTQSVNDFQGKALVAYK